MFMRFITEILRCSECMCISCNIFSRLINKQIKLLFIQDFKKYILNMKKLFSNFFQNFMIYETLVH